MNANKAKKQFIVKALWRDYMFALKYNHALIEKCRKAYFDYKLNN